MKSSSVIKEKACQQCGEIFTTKRKNGNTLGKKQFSLRKFCSYRCNALSFMTKDRHDKMVASRKSNGGYTSENNGLYIDGRCKVPGYLSWTKNRRNRLKRVTIIEFGSHTFEEWQELKKKFNYTCPCCGKSEPEINLTEDHIIPLSKNGTDLINNIQPLCLICNISKHTKIVQYYCEKL
jgi:hypothetical protein